ncbi:ExbD/TolR family protein [Niabella hibiscisoli]|uniref:ExbD/TolR family protein n=1 Tax=Niabella hibiscisoli TaxID=1825928 RepID=UPI001F10DC6C|nr:biopolymer transporter ExbD [Niabella hibiscisoli]MCH5716859.1 biopolymer transporter ExbD [Niabella hibiscisoli]
MDNIETNQSQSRVQRGFARKQKRASLRIDMTPMVDLGFLLITFFIFTSSMNDPKTMDLYMPEDGPETPIAESGAFTILLDKDAGIYYYEGQPANNDVKIKKSSLSDIRKELIRKKQEVIKNYKPDKACEEKAVANQTTLDNCRQKDLTVLIKPTTDASYQAIVAMLDEMTINKIARYVLTEPDAKDLALLQTIK